MPGAWALSRLPVVPVPKGLIGQPIDSREVADRMVELALSEPAGRVEDVGGPEVRTVDDVIRAYLDVIETWKKTLTLPLPGKTARAMRSGVLTCPENRYGHVRWEEFLREEMHDSPGARCEAHHPAFYVSRKRFPGRRPGSRIWKVNSNTHPGRVVESRRGVCHA